jgi:hypothetical protein
LTISLEKGLYSTSLVGVSVRLELDEIERNVLYRNARGVDSQRALRELKASRAQRETAGRDQFNGGGPSSKSEP